MNKDLRVLARKAKKCGWEITQTRNCHIVFLSPAGERVVTSSTPSDYRTLKNLTARLRQRGLAI